MFRRPEFTELTTGWYSFYVVWSAASLKVDRMAQKNTQINNATRLVERFKWGIYSEYATISLVDTENEFLLVIDPDLTERDVIGWETKRKQIFL